MRRAVARSRAPGSRRRAALLLVAALAAGCTALAGGCAATTPPPSLPPTWDTTGAAATGALPPTAAPPAERADLPPRWEPERTFAVLVSLVEWRSPGLAPFDATSRRDADLAAALERDGVPRAQIVFLADRAAPRDAIAAAVSDIAARVPPDGTLLFYFQGHGLQHRGRVYLAGWDADETHPSETGFGVDQLAGILRATFRGARLLLFADACHSGALADVVRDEEALGVRAAALTSATDSNVSTSRWTFTEALLAILAGDGLPDADGDGQIDFAEADAFIHRRMRFREDQLTHGVRSIRFEPGFLVRAVDPLRRPPPSPPPWRVGDYVECEQRGRWYRAEVTDARAATGGAPYRVHYIGYGDAEDEWVARDRLRPPRPSTWMVGARVEVSWKGRFYPATILRAEEDTFYYVAYDDEPAEWSEWVTERRMRAPGAAAPPP